jgi:ElaB/YqjD/DUF883 family membrane-anchored ribosome-binding protein
MKQANGLDSTEGQLESDSTLNKVKGAVADKLSAAADMLEGEIGGKRSAYGWQAAGVLNRSADYVRDLNPDQIAGDVQNEVRRNPGRSLLIAAALGLLVGVLVRRR